eukprot:scaffold34128_cov39-Cyclotella_meneghiniana.AAC.2
MHHGRHFWPYLLNYWEFGLPPAATTPPGPNVNIQHTVRQCHCYIHFTSANFTPPSPTWHFRRGISLPPISPPSHLPSVPQSTNIKEAIVDQQSPYTNLNHKHYES